MENTDSSYLAFESNCFDRRQFRDCAKKSTNKITVIYAVKLMFLKLAVCIVGNPLYIIIIITSYLIYI